MGNANATAQNALLLSVLQDTFGRLSTIIFAARFGLSFEPECKRYRLLADVFNDMSILCDCLSPMLPLRWRVLVLVMARIMSSLCGVAASSAKASLSAHFAINGNLGELNAVRFHLFQAKFQTDILPERLFARNHHFSRGHARRLSRHPLAHE